MTPQSDYIGVRLVGGDLSLAVRDEILSRGVPVGAVEVPPSGELIMLMRGRLVTAGYPVVAVLTRGSIDRLAQARPGDQVSLHLIDRETAMREIETLEGSHLETSARVASAFRARGLERLLDARHASYV
jgi:allophanate hydrolase subunit 2